MDVIKWIDNRTILKVYRGSHSYGTNHENSDIDFGGICIPPKEYIIGFENFEQYECKDYINYHNYKVENNKAENTKIDSNNESIENAEYSTIELLNSDLERVIDW